MKSSFLLLLVFILLTPSTGFSTRPHSPRVTLPLDRDWKFRFGHAQNPALDFNFTLSNIFAKSGKAENTAIDPKYSDASWRQLDLPHDWAVELPFVYSPDFDVQSHGYKPVGGLYPETSIGWYRKHFTVTASDSGKRFSLRFDGVFRDARFWLNGFYLGRNESGYIGVTWDITDYVNFTGENVITVRVDATQYEGWFYEGAGIYRHVWLEIRDQVHFPEGGTFVWPEVSAQSADVYSENEVVNQGYEPVNVTLSAYITDRNGKHVAAFPDQQKNIQPGKTVLFTENVTVTNPRLWSPDDPYLYRLVVLCRVNDRITDSTLVKFGIKSVAFDPAKGFFLNQKPMKIYGVCCHQDHAGVGSALPDHLQYYRVKVLKDLGMNAYRCSHNAPTPELLDACDSLGLLVMDEHRLLNSSPEYISQLERLIRRDRNHASVFLWSIGNEEGMIQTNGIGKRIALSLIAKQQELDPSRTCTYAADVANVFPGVNEVIPVRGFNYRHKGVEPYHQDHPLQPVIGTEMGSTVTTRGILEKDTVRCYLPDQDITAPWWASTAEEWWQLCAAQPWWTGSFIWTGFDYRGEPTPFKWPNINSHFGITDMCGFRKNVSWYYQSWWTGDDILHISPHWNWKGKEGEMIKVWVNSNADEVELRLNGKKLGRKSMERNSHLSWEVPYKPGKLEATGFRNGKKQFAVVETTDEPVRLVLEPDRTAIRGDGRDGCVVNVHAVDSKGRPVPDAINMVKFSLNGPGEILGVGNGDPSSHEPDKCMEGSWQRSLFSGRCQLILRGLYEPGNIRLEASSDGLQSAMMTLEVN